MKNTKKLFLGFIVCFMLMMTLSIHAFAAIPITTIKAGQTVTLKDYTYRYYKFTVPADGYLTLTTKDDYLYIHDKINAKDDVFHYDDTVQYVYRKASKYVAITKGTHYFSGLDNGYSLKFKFTKATFGSNYCMAKAPKLAAGKTVVAVQVPNYNYSRWYKIVLPKKKAIVFWTNSDSHITLYDADHEEIRISHDTGDKYYSYSKLKKGTYYVRIRPAYTYEEGDSTEVERTAISFKWK